MNSNSKEEKAFDKKKRQERKEYLKRLEENGQTELGLLSDAILSNKKTKGKV